MQKPSSWVAMPAGVVLVAVALAVPVSAHHGWEDYQDEQFEITGALETPVSLAGPHATATMRVNGDVWDVVLAPSPRTARAGLTEGVVRPEVGEREVLDEATLEIKTERLTWNGKVFNVYPDRN